MQFIELKNPRVLDILERFRYLYRDKYDITETNRPLSDLLGHGEEYVSEEYLKEVLKKGRDHNGSPRAAFSYPIKPDHYRGTNTQYKKDYQDVDTDMKIELGFQSSALTQLYPPKGFIDWHNNANSTSYNILFTWSETGDGWFKWYDKENDKIVTMPDKKGWSAKAGYFGNYHDGDLCYHSAYTDCWRMTMAYIVPHDAKEYWELLCDYIQNED